MYELDPLALGKNLDSVRKDITTSQYLRGLKAVSFLKKGACTSLPAKSAYIYGSLVTDSVATWIKKALYAVRLIIPHLTDFALTDGWL